MTNAKTLVFSEDARLKLLNGLDQLCQTVNITLGPKGKQVALSRSIGSPKITSDSSHIVDEIELKDQFENLAVELAQEMAGKIKEKSGDGITTALVLLEAIVKEGLKNVAGGESPVFIKKGLEKGLKIALQAIDEQALPIKTAKETENIATVSAKGNELIGKIISECFQKTGKNGVISIEEAKGMETKIEMALGMEIERGYISPYFCTNAEKLTVEMNSPYILITDKKISSVQDLLPILQNIAAIGSELLIIADDIEGDALASLVINKLKQILKVAAIKAPSFGDEKKAVLEDIAILTGGSFLTEEKGLVLTKANVSDLGRAEKVIISKDKTTFINGKGEKKALEKRISEIDHLAKNAESDYEKEKLLKRKAKLQGGVAIIQVGAGSDSELKQKKNLFEDSLAATHAALEEGIVAGGGVSLIRAMQAIKAQNFSEEEKSGAEILQKALLAPFKTLLKNGDIDPLLYLEKIEKSENKNFGFNVETEKLEDLVKAGILDPAKIVKNGLLHAVSTGIVILLSEVLIVDATSKEN